MSISELFPPIYQRYIDAKNSVHGNVDRLLLKANAGNEFCWEAKSFFPFRCFQSSQLRSSPIETSLREAILSLTKMVDNNGTTANALLLQHEHLQEFVDTLVHIASHVEEKFRINPKRAARLTQLSAEKERLLAFKQQMNERVARQVKMVLRPIPPLPSLGKTPLVKLDAEPVEMLLERVLRKESQAAKTILQSQDLLAATFQNASEDALQELFTLLLTEKWGATLEALLLPFKDGKLPFQVLADRKMKSVITRILEEVIRKKELTFLKQAILASTKSRDLILHLLAKNDLQLLVNQTMGALTLSSEEIKNIVTTKGASQMTLVHYMVMREEGITPFVQLLKTHCSADLFSMLRAMDADNHSPMFYAAKYKNDTFLNMICDHFQKQREDLLKLFSGVMVVMTQKGDLKLFSLITTKFGKNEIRRLFDTEYQFSRLLVHSAKRKKYLFLKTVLAYLKNEAPIKKELFWYVIQELFENGDETLFDCLRDSMSSHELYEMMAEVDNAQQPLIFSLALRGHYSLLGKIADHFFIKDPVLAFKVMTLCSNVGNTLISLLCNNNDVQARHHGAAFFKKFCCNDASLCMQLIEQAPQCMERCIASLVTDSHGYALVDALLKASSQIRTKLKDCEDAGMSVGFAAYIAAKEQPRRRPLKQMVLDDTMTQYKDQMIAYMIKRGVQLVREADFKEVIDANSRATLAHVIVEKGLVRTYKLCMRRESFSDCCSRNKNREGKTPEQLADEKREFQEYQKQHGDEETVIIYRRV